MKLGTIKTRYGVAEIVSMGSYSLDNSPVVQLFLQDGEPLMRLTVCIEGSNLQPGEILVKTWSENGPFIGAILALGIFEDTGRRVPSGHVEAQVWRKK